MNNIGIIQARCSSSRLPGKVLLPLAGIPMIHHIYNRALRCGQLTDVIVATSSDYTDLPLVEYCEKNEIPVFTGSLNNVLSRYVNILNDYKADYFVRITGDCPLIHPPFIDFQINLLSSNNADFIRLDPEIPLLDGQGAMSSRSLLHVAESTSSVEDQEHVGSIFIEDNLAIFDVIKVKVLTEFSETIFDLSIDEYADYNFMCNIYDKFYNGNIIDVASVVNFLAREKDLIKNRKVFGKSRINSELEKKRKNSKFVVKNEVTWNWI